MGITGLWPILQPISQRVDFNDYATDHGFLPKYGGARVFHIGVDASVLLDGYSAAQLTRGRFLHHATSDTSLSQLFKFLSQLSNAPVDCTFVFDGDDRPDLKRGKKVVKKEPFLYRKARELIAAYGFRNYDAKGDADAELAVMNRLGIIDAVLTKDSDVFPLGARLVFKVVPFECTITKLVVDIYDAEIIAAKLKLTTGGLILYSLLAGNDFDSGVKGFGSVTALAVAQYGDGDLDVGSSQQARFAKIKLKIVKRLMHSTDKRMVKRARKLSETEFPSQEALNWFLSAPTSWSNSSQRPDTTAWMPQGHNLAKIARFCIDSIGWSITKTLEELEGRLWRGAVIRILCSKYLMYDPADGSLLAPLRQAALYSVNGRPPFAITNSTKIEGRNPPKLTDKGSGSAIRITFDVADLAKLTLLQIPPSCQLKRTLNVFVPFPILAAATGQKELIPSCHSHRPGYLNTASVRTSAMVVDVEDDSSGDDVEITDFRFLVPVLDISSIDDIL